MATKSKNYKVKIALKAIAFILMIALVFASAATIWPAALRCNGYGTNVIDVIADKADGKDNTKDYFWRSDMVSERTATDATYLYLYAKYYHNEAAVKDGSVFKPLEEEIWNDYVGKAKYEYETKWGEANQKARNSICELSNTDSNSEYYGKYNDYSNIPEEVLHDYITKNHPDWIPDKEQIKNDYEKGYEARVAEIRQNFNIFYHETIRRVEKIYNLNYVIVMPDGSRLTNFDEGNTLTHEQLAEKIKSSSYGYGFSKDNNVVFAGNYESYYPLISLHPTHDRLKYVTILNDISIGLVHSGNPRAHDAEYCDRLFLDSGMDFYLFAKDKFYAGDDAGDGYTGLYLEFADTIKNLKTGLACAAAAIIILIVLLIFSGTRNEDGTIKKSRLDAIWNDYHFILSAGAVAAAGCGVFLAIDNLWWQKQPNGFMLLGSRNMWEPLAWICTTIIFALLAEWLMSVVRQVKARNYWRHTSIAAIARKVKNRPKKRRIRNKIRTMRDKLNSRPYKMRELRKDIWKFLVLYLLGNFIIILPAFWIAAQVNSDAIFILLFAVALIAVYNSAITVFLWKSIKALDEIMHAVDEAEQGNLNVNLNINLMPRWIRKFSQDVQDVQNGMRAAVQEAVKGERMKTELITNVSHDLKTPLTSIVSYVDLLKKRPIDDAEALEYIGVLDEKSARLKHLIEDLVEASKTTTGNVELHPVNLNLNELAVQSAGENEDALTAQGLEIRLNHQPENPIIVYADNQKTWRIIENLISNVRKYALEGTRVYISVEHDGAFGVFSIKNITREALDVTPEELTQRFVRGDASRSTEGSGLGLSIAANLCSLQGGKLDITIDGDLFKVTVYLPLAK